MTAKRRGNGEGTIVKRADGRFAGAATVTGTDGTKSRKWVYGHTRAEAVDKLSNLIGRSGGCSAAPRTCSLTLDEYLTYWFTEVASVCLRPTTVSKYRTAIDLYLRPGLGAILLDRLTVGGVQKFLNARLRGGDSAQKVRWIREVLSSALGRAVREDLVLRNVAQMTTLPAVPERRRVAWTAAQARAFLRASVADAAHPVFVLALLYGLRRGEIAALRWSDLDFECGELTIQRSLVRVDGRLVSGPTKSRASRRTLPIVELARNAFDEQSLRQARHRAEVGADWRDTAYVFTTRSGGPVDPRNLSRSFDRLVASSGLPKINFHDMRRTAVTLMKDLGVSARDAQVILGHSHVSVTLGIYSEVFDWRLSSAIQRVSHALTADACSASR